MIDLRPYVFHLPAQGRVGCCATNACLLSAEILCKMHGKPQLFSRLFLYYFTRKIQNRFPHSGASLRSTLATMSSHGVCTDAVWPMDVQKQNIMPPQHAIDEALNYKAVTFKSIDKSEIKDWLNKRTPVIVGMWVGQQFPYLSGPIENQRYVPVDTVGNKVVQGHAVTIVGYDDNLNGGSWIIANSAGHLWGQAGFAAIPYACTADILDAYVLNSFAGLSF